MWDLRHCLAVHLVIKTPIPPFIADLIFSSLLLSFRSVQVDPVDHPETFIHIKSLCDLTELRLRHISYFNGRRLDWLHQY